MDYADKIGHLDGGWLAPLTLWAARRLPNKTERAMMRIAIAIGMLILVLG